MLERTMTNTHGPFQQMIGNMMLVVNAPIRLQNFFLNILCSKDIISKLDNVRVR